MAKASDNEFPSVLLVEQGSAPADPAAGNQRLYIDSADHKLYLVDEAGAVTPVGGSGGGFDAEFAQSLYDTAVIALGTSTDGAFVDADATNAKITFTPAAAGKYRVTFTFSVYRAAAGINTFFRLTDGTTQSPAQELYSGGAINNTAVVTLSFVFTWAAAAQTVKLQKKILAATTVTTHDVEADSGNGVGLYMAVERIGA